ncbi:insulin receptor-like isoform X2 [Corticium candelabrum]|uniref:insulin receptor-like isoform X2 n=1 Tax=Corticium candelabrum TaxID=121492 RepID=UPI002E26C815|nr:insulin receptor-like isoform X2 [Corticium candelabrum]
MTAASVAVAIHLAAVLLVISVLSYCPTTVVSTTTPERCAGRIVTTLQHVEDLKNCSIIYGPLLISGYNLPSTLPFLTNVTQITHFLLVADLPHDYKSISQILPKLTVIRGHKLLNDRWALVLKDNGALETIGIRPRVLDGSVFLDNNPFLVISHMDPWYAGLNSTGQIYESGRLLYEVVNTKSNQPTIIPPLSECNPLNSVYHQGLCHRSCPNGTFIMDGLYCVEECQKVASYDFETYSVVGKQTYLYSAKNKCVDECPTGFQHNSATLGCEECNNSCVTECNAPRTAITNSQVLEQLKGCNKIKGNLEISINLELYEEADEYLNEVQEISGYLLIFRCHGFKSLNFFRNLKRIASDATQDLWQDKYGLALVDNSDLAHLWPNFRNIEVPSNVSAYVEINPQLCQTDLKNIKTVFSQNVFVGKGNAITGICENDPLVLTFTNVTTTSLNVRWQQRDPNSTFTLNYTVFTYFVYYISFPKLKHDDSVSLSKAMNVLEEASLSTFNGWSLLQVSAHTTSATVTDLDSDTMYAFYVVAYSTSDTQAGQESNITTMRTRAAPFTVQNVTASDCCPSMNGSIRVSWIVRDKAMKHNFSYVVHYEALHPGVLKRLKQEGLTLSYPRLQRDTNNACLMSCHPDDVKDEHEDFEESEERYDAVENTVDALALQSALDVCQSSTQTATSNSNSLILRDLKPYTFYFISVQTNLSNGCGPISDAQLALTAPVVDADKVRNLSIALYNTPDQSQIVHVSWQPPSSPNGGYVVSYEILFQGEITVSISNETTNCKKESSLEFTCFSGKDEASITRSFVVESSNCQDGMVTVTVETKSLFDGFRYDMLAMVRTTFTVDCSQGTKSKENGLVIGLCIVCGLCLVFVVSFVCVCLRSRRMRRRLEGKRGSGYFGILYGNSENIAMTANDEYQSDDWEVDCHDVTMGEMLGEGAFGSVHSGTLKTDRAILNVAIKKLMPGSSQEDRIQFLNEASVMKLFRSDHVVRLLGIVSKTSPTLVIMELMGKGDLKSYLRTLRPQEFSGDMYSFLHFPITEDDQLQMAAQIAAGMAYLAQKKVIHRDLAARNCMIADNGAVKIGDFGMARDAYVSDYYRKRGRGPMPVRWMAPESLQDGIFTTASDIWSYGIVLWEISTLGAQPYPGKSNEEVMRFVIGRQLMDVNDLKSSPDIYVELMITCWNFSAFDRPLFEEVLSKLPAVKGYEVQV